MQVNERTNPWNPHGTSWNPHVDQIKSVLKETGKAKDKKRLEIEIEEDRIHDHKCDSKNSNINHCKNGRTYGRTR